MHKIHPAVTVGQAPVLPARRILLPAICAMMAWLLVACSGGKERSGADSALSDTPETDTVSPDAAEPDLTITAAGVGPIAIGMRTGDIPPAKEGMYDFVSAEDGYGSNTYIFVRGESPLFTAYEFTEGTIDVISAESPVVAVVAPGGERLRLGDEFAHVLALPGVEAEWENADGDGMWCWHWEGLWFQPDQSSLPEELGRELYSDVAPPALSSFTPDVRIGYIGTGLPW